jgi:hypothetical protein
MRWLIVCRIRKSCTLTHPFYLFNPPYPDSDKLDHGCPQIPEIMRQLQIVLLLLPLIWGCRKETDTTCSTYNDAEKIIVISDRFEDSYHDHMMDTVIRNAPVYVYSSYPYDDIRWMIGKDSSLQNALFNQPNFVLRFPQPGKVTITMIGTKRFPKDPCNGNKVIIDTLKQSFIIGEEGYDVLSGIYSGSVSEGYTGASFPKTVKIYRDFETFFYIKGIPEDNDSLIYIAYSYSPTDRPISLGIDSALVYTSSYFSTFRTYYGYWLSRLDYNTRTRALTFKFKPFVQNRLSNSGFEYQPTQTFIGYRQ